MKKMKKKEELRIKKNEKTKKNVRKQSHKTTKYNNNIYIQISRNNPPTYPQTHMLPSLHSDSTHTLTTTSPPHVLLPHNFSPIYLLPHLENKKRKRKIKKMNKKD